MDQRLYLAGRHDETSGGPAVTFHHGTRADAWTREDSNNGGQGFALRGFLGDENSKLHPMEGTEQGQSLYK